MTVKYAMQYTLYTLVDISHTNQFRHEQGLEELLWKEQNFQTVLQTLGMRANITYSKSPEVREIVGSTIGFKTELPLRVWCFEFETEREFLYENDGDPVGFLKEDFHLIPYISGLSELMEQKYAVFNCYDPGSNIIFHAN